MGSGLRLQGGLLVLVAIALAAQIVGGLSAEPPATRMVVFGDSFSSAMDSVTRRSDAGTSWATGDDRVEGSIVQRLAAEHGPVDARNLAFGGARVEHVGVQLEGAPSQADLVLVWVGINDVCNRTRSVEDFQRDVAVAFGALQLRYDEAQVLVFGLPDLVGLHEEHLREPQAVALWLRIPYCEHILSASLDAAEAEAARGRVDDFDRSLRLGAADAGFHFADTMDAYGAPLASWTAPDYFHPSGQGSALLAEAAWPAVERLLH